MSNIPMEGLAYWLQEAAIAEYNLGWPGQAARIRVWAAEVEAARALAAPVGEMKQHRQGCDALGGYGHGVGPCTCGAAHPVPKGEAMEVLRELVEALDAYATFPVSIKPAVDRARALTARLTPDEPKASIGAPDTDTAGVQASEFWKDRNADGSERPPGWPGDEDGRTAAAHQQFTAGVPTCETASGCLSPENCNAGQGCLLRRTAGVAAADHQTEDPKQ